jgi:hypothetical protein
MLEIAVLALTSRQCEVADVSRRASDAKPPN